MALDFLARTFSLDQLPRLLRAGLAAVDQKLLALAKNSLASLSNQVLTGRRGWPYENLLVVSMARLTSVSTRRANCSL